MPFFAGLGVPSDEFLFLGIDADHRVAGGEELPCERVDVSKLVVPVRVLTSLQLFAGAL
jgi:hypothetical protein